MPTRNDALRLLGALFLLTFCWLTFPAPSYAQEANSVTITLDWNTVLAPLVSGLFAAVIALLTAVGPMVYKKIPRPLLPLLAVLWTQAASYVAQISGSGTGTLKGGGLTVLALLMRAVYKHFTGPKDPPLPPPIIIERPPAEFPRIDQGALVKEVLSHVVAAIKDAKVLAEASDKMSQPPIVISLDKK